MERTTTPEQWNELGLAFQQGRGRDTDHVKAAQCFMKAAAQGHAEAQANLAMCYANGEGVAHDPGEAVRLFGMAAEQGDAFAQYSLGVCCYQGIGTAQDPLKAIEWFKKAAEQGEENAIYNLEALNVKRCPTCMKWDTIYSQRIHNGKDDMLVCINEQCPDWYIVYNFATREVISGKICPTCGNKRDPFNSGAWVCWNEKCSQYKQIDRRF